MWYNKQRKNQIQKLSPGNVIANTHAGGKANEQHAHEHAHEHAHTSTLTYGKLWRLFLETREQHHVRTLMHGRRETDTCRVKEIEWALQLMACHQKKKKERNIITSKEDITLESVSEVNLFK